MCSFWLCHTSLHDRRFMSQVGRTRGECDISRRARHERSCRAPREISRSPRLAHKAPVMQANVTLVLFIP